jgi:uncharacterized protein (DUF2267 family)
MNTSQHERPELSPEQQDALRRSRTDSRASATYKAFLKELRSKGFDSDASAERAAAAVLCVLEQRLTSSQSWNLESQLPLKLRELLSRCKLHIDLLPRQIHRDEFLQLVAEGIGGDEADALRAVDAVFDAIANQVTAGEIQKVIHQLPHDLRELWPLWARAAEEVRRIPRSSGAARVDSARTLESAPELVDDFFALPRSAQLGVLRTIAPRLLAQLDATEREGFVRDLNREISLANEGHEVYDVRRSAGLL